MQREHAPILRDGTGGFGEVGGGRLYLLRYHGDRQPMKLQLGVTSRAKMGAEAGAGEGEDWGGIFGSSFTVCVEKKKKKLDVAATLGEHIPQRHNTVLTHTHLSSSLSLSYLPPFQTASVRLSVCLPPLVISLSASPGQGDGAESSV